MPVARSWKVWAMKHMRGVECQIYPNRDPQGCLHEKDLWLLLEGNGLPW